MRANYNSQEKRMPSSTTILNTEKVVRILGDIYNRRNEIRVRAIGDR